MIQPMRDTTAEGILKRMSNLEDYPNEALAAYEEFRVGVNTYYFTPGDSSTGRTQEQRRWVASSVGISPMRSGTIGYLSS